MNIENKLELTFKAVFQAAAVTATLYTGQDAKINTWPKVSIRCGTKEPMEGMVRAGIYHIPVTITVESEADSKGESGQTSATRLTTHQNLVNQIERVALTDNLVYLLNYHGQDNDIGVYEADEDSPEEPPDMEERKLVYMIGLRVTATDHALTDSI